MIYADSSALMKLVRLEAESEPLRRWFAARPESPVVTSELGRVEVLRAAARLGARAASEAHAVIDDVDLLVLDRSVQDLACDLGGSSLRTLDALHLATAVLLREELVALVAYDARLLDAAAALDLPVASPGR